MRRMADELEPLDSFAVPEDGCAETAENWKIDKDHVPRCHVWPARSERSMSLRLVRRRNPHAKAFTRT